MNKIGLHSCIWVSTISLWSIKMRSTCAVGSSWICLALHGNEFSRYECSILTEPSNNIIMVISRQLVWCHFKDFFQVYLFTTLYAENVLTINNWFSNIWSYAHFNPILSFRVRLATAQQSQNPPRCSDWTKRNWELSCNSWLPFNANLEVSTRALLEVVKFTWFTSSLSNSSVTVTNII